MLLTRVGPVLAAVAVTAACTSGSGGTPADSPPATTSTISTPSVAASTPTADPAPRTSAPTTSPAVPTGATDSGGTNQIVVRPVSAAGVVTPGWSVRIFGSTVDCSGGLRSPVSQSADVLYCAPSAASATACWRAADGVHAYCLRDPRARTLARYGLSAGFPAAGPTELEPAPVALDLADGAQCSIRGGGAAAQLRVHPDWVPYYFCGSQDATAVWAEPSATDGGVSRGDGPWTVQVADGDGAGPLRTVQVRTAYLVGTA